MSDPAAGTGEAPGQLPHPAQGELQRRYLQQVQARHYSEDAEQLAVLAHLEALRARLEARPRTPRWLARLLPRPVPAPERGLYLYGGVGRGKTWLMDLFFDSLTVPARRRHFHRFMHDVHAQLAQLKAQSAPLERVADEIACECRVLCFDELYVSDIADAMLLGGLFAALFARGVTLVATSNTAPADLYKDGLQRQRFLPGIALLERHLEVLHIGGSTDYRLRQLTQARIYLPVGSPDTEPRLLALFSELGAAGTQTGGHIQIEGRPIPVQRAAHGAVWFDFAALCAGARSQEDYIEIAREYHSVIVSGVPVLTDAQANEARRFIALVDEFYDRNVKLIISAAAAPPGLYRGEALRAPFARTASRLTEMQSQEYLARQHRP